MSGYCGSEDLLRFTLIHEISQKPLRIHPGGIKFFFAHAKKGCEV